jgi:tRNA 5-methylaminomethyl-2-thiouridine biosynthesis bifunctional protein
VKTRPIEPAQIAFEAGPGGVPLSPTFGDVYHPRVGALAQARHVFLGGNGLPARWAGRRHFTVLETGFGLGNNFLALWDAWRADPDRCQHLHVVSIERHPPRRDDLQRAHVGSPLPDLAAALVAAWPPLTPNLHALDFEEGRVRLLLALGDVADLLPALRLQADAFFLDGFAPARNPQMWQQRVLKALGRRAAPGATLATWSVARELREGLGAAGFEVQRTAGIGGKRDITVARWAPRFALRKLPLDHAHQPQAETAVVVGAGLAGAAAARALADLGLTVTVLDRHRAPAQGASGNTAGLFHGSVNPDDGPHARLFRAAALQARRDCAQAVALGRVTGQLEGLLRVAPDGTAVADLAALLAHQGLPADYVQALDAAEASALAGVTLRSPAWFYPGGGWLAPGEWVAHALEPVRFVGGVDVGSLSPASVGPAGGWLLRDTAGRTVARAPIVVLAHAAQAARLLETLGPLGWPLSHTRGQVTQWAGVAGPLRRPLAGDGYAIPLADGGLLCGATRQAEEPADGEDSASLREADHRHNLERLQRLTGLRAPEDPGTWLGRAGWRLQADDRLPIGGGVPQWPPAPGVRLDQARLLPRQGGLFVLTALGARGLTLAPLLGRLVAAQATGTPWPLEQDLADAIDPGRWRVRAVRKADQPPFPSQAAGLRAVQPVG